ncbi:MAG: beta-lactamase family protein, partial [Mesorhizobium sp.]
IYESVLDESKAFAHYLPELRGSAFEEATLRQAMDMQTGLHDSEDYDDKSSLAYTDHVASTRFRGIAAVWAAPARRRRATTFSALCATYRSWPCMPLPRKALCDLLTAGARACRAK